MRVRNKLSVVIPAFCGMEQLAHCLHALELSEYRNINVIVVDHGVSDTISNWLNTHWPTVSCLRGTPELWWAGATNLGIKHALATGDDAVILLNHDCYVETDTIGTLIRHASENPGCVIAPTQQDIRTKRKIIGITSLLFLGFPTIIVPTWAYRFFRGPTLIATHLIAGGRGVLIPRNIFHEIGYFDEKRLPHYYADHDFYFRCRRAGVKLLVCTDTKVIVDDAMTSVANKYTNLSYPDFRESLTSRRSHRNLRDLYALFSKHCSLRGLAGFSVVLNLARYSIVYFLKYCGRKIWGNSCFP